MITSFIIVVVLTMFSSLIGIVSLYNIHNKSVWVYKYYGEAQGTVNNFMAEFKNNQLLMSKIINSENTSTRTEYLNKLEESGDKINSIYAGLKSLYLSGEGKAIMSELDVYAVEYQELRDTLIKQVKSGNMDQAKSVLLDKVTPLSEQVSGVIDDLISNKQDNGSIQMNSLEGVILISGIIIVAFIVISVILSMLMATKISTSISSSVSSMLEGMDSLADGNLNVNVPVLSKDEIGQLTEEFNNTCATLKSYVDDINRAMNLIANGDLTVRETFKFKGDFLVMQNNIIKMIESENNLLLHINQASTQVYAGSDQVAGGSQALAEGANEQAGTVEELSDTVLEIARQIDETTKNAEESSRQSNHAGSVLNTANEKMIEMKQSMVEINQSAVEISKIISAINDIASQTNLLALNASIEAARAGDAGKGFAVVADQVTVLAKQSADAAKESNQLIETSVRAVEKGQSIAEELAGAMQVTIESAQSAVQSVVKISEAAKQQSESITQVSMGIKQISNVVQDNSSTAEECAAASQELTAQAEELKRLVGEFKLREK